MLGKRNAAFAYLIFVFRVQDFEYKEGHCALPRDFLLRAEKVSSGLDCLAPPGRT